MDSIVVLAQPFQGITSKFHQIITLLHYFIANFKNVTNSDTITVKNLLKKYKIVVNYLHHEKLKVVMSQTFQYSYF